MRKLLLLCVCFCLFLLISAAAQPKLGQQSPEIALPDVNGVVQRLSALKGKVVLIDFWASWCIPCRRSNKELSRLYTKYKIKGFEIYGVSIDERKEDWKRGIIADRITWKQVNEPGAWDSPIVTNWNLQQIPSSYLLDQQGKIIAIDPGRGLESRLKKLLK